jgi:AmmeMemoRadiSam system protein A
MELTEKGKETLLEVAKKSIESRLKNESMPEFKSNDPALAEKRGAFVTIKKKGHLRGCIGYINAVKDLEATVKEMARAAAFNDPRFAPVTEGELPQLSFEISVLTPLKEIESMEEIVVGVHGLYITKGSFSGLLLPQVATEYQWDRKTFLEHTCQKAGLPPNSWKDKNTKIYVFSAEIFGDSKE